MTHNAEVFYQTYQEVKNCAEVARRFGVTRQYVNKVLNDNYPHCLKRRKSRTIKQEVSGN